MWLLLSGSSIVWKFLPLLVSKIPIKKKLAESDDGGNFWVGDIPKTKFRISLIRQGEALVQIQVFRIFQRMDSHT